MRSNVAARALCLAAAAALAPPGCGGHTCRERLVDLRESPDHRYNAALLVQTCAGGSVATHVNLHDGYGGPPQESDGRATRGEVFSVEGERKVVVTWEGPRSLQIECVGCEGQKVARRDGSWEDVQVTYAARE